MGFRNRISYGIWTVAFRLSWRLPGRSLQGISKKNLRVSMKWLWKTESCKGTCESWLCQVDNLPLPAGGGGPAARQVGRQQQLASRSATSHRAASRPRHAHLTDLFTNTHITLHPLENHFAQDEENLRSVASTEETAVCPNVCNSFPQSEHALWIGLLRAVFFHQQEN